MCDDQQHATNLHRRRNIPALTKQEEITPETPRSELSSDQQRSRSVNVKGIAK